MKCHYCGKKAVKVNITESRTGAGVVRVRTPACAVHAGLELGDTCNANIIRFNEQGKDRFADAGDKFKREDGTWKRQSR